MLTGAVCLVAGLLITVSAVNSRGIDLRPGRNTDLVGLVQSESRRNAELAGQVTRLRAEVDQLATQQGAPAQDAELEQRSLQAGMEAVTGPAVTVTLNDAPPDVAANGIDPDLLVVHQQDIQAIVNLLWAGGAEAVTIQGQRVISTTGVKCVGNTVILHGIPYAPPYVISGIGNQARLRATLKNSEYVRIFQQYVDRYRMGFSITTTTRATFPAYRGALDLRYARVPQSPSPTATH
ncbi:MAG: DUF881 domain-containing protein [Microlunatus sp.]|nr:DUF881 domain-containing protein [Microlunatus sp.]